MPDPVLAIQTFGIDGARIWVTSRSAAGTWSASSLYTDASDVGGFSQPGLRGVSAGTEIAANASNPRGVIGHGGDGPWYLGQGKPATAYSVKVGVDNLPTGGVLLTLDFYDASHGAWTIGGELWLMLNYQVFNSGTGTFGPTQVAMLRATTFDGSGIPTGWHIEDLSNQPQLAKDLNHNIVSVRWDGASSTLDVITTVGGSATVQSTTYAFHTFDTVSRTWSAPFGVLDFGREIIPGYSFHGSWGGNCIYRYPNGDLGIVYTDATTSWIIGKTLYYRLYAGGTWSSEVTIKAYGSDIDSAFVGQVIPDLGGEKLHVFDIRYRVTGEAAGTYHIVDHGGTIHTDLFHFPDRIDGETDGFGHGLIYDGKLLVPYDDTSSTSNSNAVWVGPITGGVTTFAEEILPKPPEEAGRVPSCSYLIYYTPGTVVEIPPSGMAIFPQYIKRHNLFSH